MRSAILFAATLCYCGCSRDAAPTGALEAFSYESGSAGLLEEVEHHVVAAQSVLVFTQLPRELTTPRAQSTRTKPFGCQVDL